MSKKIIYAYINLYKFYIYIKYIYKKVNISVCIYIYILSKNLKKN